MWIVPLVALTLTQIAAIATSVYLHRGLAHRSLRLHPVADVGFRVVLWLTTGQTRREWVAVHRKHHTFTDREGDPHSPRLLGLWRVQLWNVYYYMREARNPETIRTFAPDVAEDWGDRRIFSRGVSGVTVGIALLCIVLGVWAGLVTGLLHAVLYVFVLAPVINGLGHWRGTQNFPNTAYNSKALSWVTGGESLHNNHHAYPRAAKFSMRRFEFDPSWLVIRCLGAVGLVEIVGAGLRTTLLARGSQLVQREMVVTEENAQPGWSVSSSHEPRIIMAAKTATSKQQKEVSVTLGECEEACDRVTARVD